MATEWQRWRMEDGAMPTPSRVRKTWFLCSELATKNRQDLRLQSSSAITRFSCRVVVVPVVVVVVVVVAVLIVVPKNLTERFIRLVSEEFAPAVKLAE